MEGQKALWCRTSQGGAHWEGEELLQISPSHREIPGPMAQSQKAHLKRVANPRLPYVVKPRFLGRQMIQRLIS